MTIDSRIERKKLSTRRNIYKMAIHLFSDQGIDQVTVEEITEACDIAKGTFFNYYPTKYHILAEYWKNLVIEVLDKHRTSKSTHARGAIKSLFRMLIKRVSLKPLLFEGLVRSNPKKPPFQSTEEQLETEILSTYSRIINDGISSGELRQGLDSRLIAETVEHIWSGTLRNWVHSGKKLNLRKVFEQKLDLLFDGLTL